MEKQPKLEEKKRGRRVTKLHHSKSKTNPLAVTKKNFGFLPCFEGENGSSHQNPFPVVKIGKMVLSW
jgi:hypothetical protein